MCYFKSCIITREKTYHLLDDDSHEAIIREFGLEDDAEKICRIEITPIDGNVNSREPSNWTLQVDQPVRPSWFSKDFARSEAWKCLEETWDARFLSNLEHVVKDGRWFACNSATVEAYGSATVRAYGSATVRACNSATVEAYDSATVKAYDSATVKAYGSATVEAYDSATVEAYGLSVVLWPHKNKIIIPKKYEVEKHE